MRFTMHSAASASPWRFAARAPRRRVRRSAGSAAARADARAAARREARSSGAASGNPPQQDQQPLPRIRTGINYVRVDAIVTDRQGNPVLDLKQDEFRIKEDGKPQIDRVVLGRQDRSDRPADRRPAAARDPLDLRRAARGAAPGRPAVHHPARRLSRAARQRHGRCASRSSTSSRTSSRRADMVAIMYPLTPVTGLTFTRNRASLISAIEHFEGRRFDYQPRNEFEEQLRLLSGGDGRADPQPGRDDGAQGRGDTPRAACARGASRSSSSAKASPRSCRRS